MAILLTADKAMTAPLPDTPIVPKLNDIWTSDGFSGATGDVAGRVADAALGGSARTWQSSPASGVWRVDNGVLERLESPASGACIGGIDFADIEIGFTIRQIGNGGLWLDARRSHLAPTSPIPAAYRVMFDVSNAGVARLSKRPLGGSNTNFSTPTPAFAIGDKFAMRCIGSRISLVKNGVEVAAVTDTEIASGAFAGLATGVAGNGWRVDDFFIRRIDDPTVYP